MVWFGISLSLLAAGAGAAAPGPSVPCGYRAALLIGNAEYGGFTLAGVGRSLDEVGRSLEEQGYLVTRHENLATKDDQRGAVAAFVRAVPTNGVALVYYTGLGAHLDRDGWQNLLRPTGEKVGNENDYRGVALDVEDDLLKPLGEESGARRVLVFLDACWESPVKPETDGLRNGLHAVEVAGEALLMFAAESGATRAVPAGDEPSPFARALAAKLAGFDESVGDTCLDIAQEIGGAWIGGGGKDGLGPPPAFPVVDDPRKASTAGDAFVNSLGMVFHWCPPGTFTMGSGDNGSAATRDRRTVEVTLTQGFWMGECEVTQREYKAVRRRDPPRDFTQHRNAPFFGMHEAKAVDEFCKQLAELERESGALPDGWQYVCPTEAEWEYACRAGSTTAYCFGDSIEELGRYANFADRTLKTENPDYHWAFAGSDDGAGEALAPVGSYLPNAWGLRDMHGNVAEMVADHLLPALPGGRDPLAQVEKDGEAVMRGGAWCSLPEYCESSFRNTPPSRDKPNFIGFRVALKRTSE